MKTTEEELKEEILKPEEVDALLEGGGSFFKPQAGGYIYNLTFSHAKFYNDVKFPDKNGKAKLRLDLTIATKDGKPCDRVWSAAA